ncbi:MAG: peroxide stress protein YaaA [Prolixibacteraceae bacterium]
MIIVISPAKSLDFETKTDADKYTRPVFLKEASQINASLRKLKPSDLVNLQSISPKLAMLNAERNQLWNPPFDLRNSKQAVLAFNGDVYDGMNAKAFTASELNLAQEKIRILSGLYGLLKPLDLIQPYRLEMGTKIRVGRHPDLYHFWKAKITSAINRDLRDSGQLLINLASQEYFKVIDQTKLKGKLITPVFKENKNGQYQVISFFAKKARGLMCRFIVTNKLEDPEDLKAFDLEGYHFNNRLTEGSTWVFTRDK